MDSSAQVVGQHLQQEIGQASQEGSQPKIGGPLPNNAVLKQPQLS